MNAADGQSIVTDLVEAVRTERVSRRVETFRTSAPGASWLRAASREARWRRTSIRSWAPGPIAGDVALGILAFAHGLTEMRADVSACPIGVVLAVADGDSTLPEGLYRLGGSPPVVRRLSGWSPDQARTSLLQAGLAAAPATLFFSGNMDRALELHGGAGMRHVILGCGAVAAAVWLKAVDEGLGACMTAGVVEHPLRAALHSNGLSEAFIVALSLGAPHPGAQ